MAIIFTIMIIGFITLMIIKWKINKMKESYAS